MTCRDNKLSSAVTSFGRIACGLFDRQDSHLFHKLTDEGEGTPDPAEWQLRDLIEEMSGQVKIDPDLNHKRKVDIIKRLDLYSASLDAGNAKPVTGPMYYAMQRFVDRARQTRVHLDEYLDAAARDLGMTRAEARGRLEEHFAAAIEGGRFCEADVEWAKAFELGSGRNLPLDRASKYAFQQLERERKAYRESQPTIVAAKLEKIDSHMFSGIGYNPELGYMEVEFLSRPGRVYSYHIPPDVYDEFRSSPDLEGYYVSRIRGNPEFTYQSAAEGEAARHLIKCPTCGRFAQGTGCNCPVTGSVEENNRTVRLARAAIIGNQMEKPQEALRLPDPVRWRHYDHLDGNTSTFPLTEIQTSAKKSGIVAAPVRGKAVEDDGTVYNQSGMFYAEYLGYGKGYYVSAVVTSGDSEQDHLKCDCPEYALHYTCKHVRGMVADLANRMNGETIKKPETTPEDRYTNPDDMVPGRYASGPVWEDPQSLWSEDSSKFRDVYDDTLIAMKTGKDPITYRTVDVSDGMGVKGKGRPVGVEIEFDFPESMSEEDREKALAAMGRAAYRSGLTGAVRQEEYLEQKNRGYSDSHERGWVFKRDATCAGEFTSPIMFDDEDTWTALPKVTGIIKRYGGIVTPSTGLHVHVSINDYRDTPNACTKLLNTFTEHEDVLYRLSTNVEAPTHRGTEHCARNVVPALGYASVNEARLTQGDNRDLAVNLQNVNGSVDDHAELRIFNGSLDPAYIQSAMLLSWAIAQDAVRDGSSDSSGGGAALGEHSARNSSATKVGWEEDSREFRSFIDRIVWSDKAKETLTQMYASTDWQSSEVASSASKAA